jgi:hypothetical protein
MKIVINHYLSLQFQPRSANAHTAKQKNTKCNAKKKIAKKQMPAPGWKIMFHPSVTAVT